MKSKLLFLIIYDGATSWHEKNIVALGTLAMKSYLEAKQSDDLRRDISARLQLSDGPFYPGDKIYLFLDRRQTQG